MQSGTNDGKNSSELGRGTAPKTRARVKKPSNTGKTLSLSAKDNTPGPKGAKTKQRSTEAAPQFGQTAYNMDGQIALAAYYLAEQRRFAPGRELEDWLMAESYIKSSATNA